MAGSLRTDGLVGPDAECRTVDQVLESALGEAALLHRLVRTDGPAEVG